MNDLSPLSTPPRGLLSAIVRFCLEQKLVVTILLLGVLAWGVLVAPFDWKLPGALGGIARDTVPVDAIPDLGENQQIVFTQWPGRSPQDIDDQISYPLTVALMGIPGVQDIRSYSVLGFSTIYIVFDEGAEFYWSRSRVLEKLASLPAGTLPAGVAPALGPDATALGQVFWYTLEGRDAEGNPSGGWDLDELRSIQDFTVKYQLASVGGVSEVASIGGFVREYQIDVNPDAMRAAGVTLAQVIDAARQSNLDVGARTIEVNRAEYVVRGLGFIESVRDLEQTAVAAREGQPILLSQIAHVGLGPAQRRGVLTKEGHEAVGGVVVARYGENPMATIERIKARIAEIAPGLPSKTLDDGTVSRVSIVPFYDRSGLIDETLGTLNSAIEQQVLITVIVVLLMVMHLRAGVLISMMLPVAVLMTFAAMKLLRIDANIVALSGIAIAIGTIVDMGIVLCENIIRKLEEAPPGSSTLETVYEATMEVGSAVLTAVATTVVGFLPVFTMVAAEGKLFKPLAYTKTFALVASIIIALSVLPASAHVLLGWRPRRAVRVPGARWGRSAVNIAVVLLVLWVLSRDWEPRGPEAGTTGNALFIGLVVGVLLLLFWAVRLAFPRILGWALRHKVVALTPALLLIVLGATIWFGFGRVWGWLPESVRGNQAVVSLAHALPGLGSEFMPTLNEGSFLYMPTMMPHVSIGEATDMLKDLDRRIMSIPEVEESVGKIGRADSPLDPAPISMVETMVRYKSEYIVDARGHRLRFRYDADRGRFARDERGGLVPDEHGRPYRQWRDEIRTPDDIWDEIVRAARMPGMTSAPRLQPIETRVVMLQSGFRAPMGVKVFGPDLETIDAFGLRLETLLKRVPSVEPEAVFADRVVGKPYLEIDIDREKIARYGLRIADVQEVIEVAIGGKPLTMTVEGRQRYPVRVRYLRELRDRPDTLGDILVATPGGAQIPLSELASIEYRRGPQMIKSEDTFLVSYVLFDKRAGVAEVDAVNDAREFLNAEIASGQLVVPAGVSFEFSGSYKNQVRASRKLMVVMPLALGIIFLLLYFQFRRVSVTLMVFSGVFVAASGGFLMLWLYAQPWFLDVNLMGVNLRELLHIRPYNLSVAVWVGFLALFGIATDDGVIMATRIVQAMKENRPATVEQIRATVIEGGRLRIRAAVMTSATTILALLPVLTSSGRGSEIMIPMAIPTFGGMAVACLTWFTVPILYCWWEERRAKQRTNGS